MIIGMIGLGRMGANMVRRLAKAGHRCVVYDRDANAARALASEGATAASSAADLLAKLPKPRIVWIMIPAAAVDPLLQSLAGALLPGDIVIDGGNSHYADDMRRGQEMSARGVHYVDVGTSGGVWGAERGYCLMVGGDQTAVQQIEPVLAALAGGNSSESAADSAKAAGANATGSASAGTGSASATAKATASTATRGYLHVGPTGAGHFVKTVHNGIEYGLMQAYAEGLNLLHRAATPAQAQAVDAETAPVRGTQPTFDLKLEQIAELWRHGSVVSSWLLDLVALQLADDPTLDHFAGRVSDSGEGRWTVQAAVDLGVPVPVLACALFERFDSRGQAEFGNRVLSAMRLGFGGHHETPTAPAAAPTAPAA